MLLYFSINKGVEMSKYLSTGTIVGGHYEILDVLGEDDFEILYLVKNIHREGSFFVIKELFLEVFSERKGNSVETIPEALGVFNKRKAEIISEIDNMHRKHIENEIKVFAYFEENGTIYSCMAYTPNAKVEDYLQFEPKEDAKLPLLEELTQMGKEEKESSPLLLIGVVFLTVTGGLILAFNQYGDQIKALNVLNTKHTVVVNSTQEKNNTTKKPEKVVQTHHIVVESNKTKIEEKKDLWANNFSLENAPQKEINITKEEVKLNEVNITKDNIVKEEKLVEENVTKEKVDETNITKNTIIKEENIEEASNSSQDDSNLSEIFSELHLRQFLNNYMEITAHASSKKIMELYDDKIKRYFQFKNITPKKVGQSVRAYNRKWKHRNFKLLDFKVLKRYSEDGMNYCDVKTRTKWYVSNPNGKSGTGHTKGFMTIENREDGFKVKAIFGVK